MDQVEKEYFLFLCMSTFSLGVRILSLLLSSEDNSDCDEVS